MAVFGTPAGALLLGLLVQSSWRAATGGGHASMLVIWARFLKHMIRRQFLFGLRAYWQVRVLL